MKSGKISGLDVEFPHLQAPTVSSISQDNHVLKDDLTYIIISVKTPRSCIDFPYFNLDVQHSLEFQRLSGRCFVLFV